MRKFTTTELDRMRDTQEDAMQDMGVVQVYTPVIRYGEEQEAWVERSTPIPVGINMTEGSENRREDMVVEVIDGEVRLPIGTEIDERDRIRVYQRFGQDISDLVISIVGTPQEGASGLLCDFVVVNPGESP